MNLKEAIARNTDAWVYWAPGDFKVRIKYLPRSEASTMIKQCTKTSFVNHEKVDELDIEKFRRKISDLVVEWENVTVGKIRKVLEIKEGILDDEQIECSAANKLALMQDTYTGFEDFILDSAKNLASVAEKRQEDEVKN